MKGGFCLTLERIDMGGKGGAFCLSPQGGCKASVATSQKMNLLHIALS